MSQINTSPVPAVISTQGPNFLPVPSLDPIASNTFISSFRLGLKSVPYTQAEGGDLFDPFMPLDTAEDDLDNIVRSTEVRTGGSSPEVEEGRAKSKAITYTATTPSATISSSATCSLRITNILAVVSLFPPPPSAFHRFSRR